MSENEQSFAEVIHSFGSFLQRSKAVSFLMVLLVFAAGTLLLRWMPNQSGLPQLNENDVIREDIVARISFKCRNMEDVDRIREEEERDFPQCYKFDFDRTDKIKNGFRTMLEEIRRRREAVNDGKIYLPATRDRTIVEFMNDLKPFLFSILSSLAEDEARRTEAVRRVAAIVDRGILGMQDPESRKEDPGRRVITQDAENRVAIYRRSELLAENAAEKTEGSLLSLLSGEQRAQLNPGALKVFFTNLYKDGNLTFDEALTLQNRKDTIEEKISKLPEKEYEKGLVLFEAGQRVSHADIELYRVYRNRYAQYQLDQRTWSSPDQLRRTSLVALLVIFSCIFILRVHPELVENNRSIWLIGFIVIFSMLFNCGIMKMFNQWLLDGRLATRIPLYLAMPLALPALVIASIYNGRSAIFAGLFVAGVSAVALDQSFPAFGAGLFVCAVSTASVRHVYDYKKFAVRAFVACFITMFVVSLIFQPDIFTMGKDFFVRLNASLFGGPENKIHFSSFKPLFIALGECLTMAGFNGIMTSAVAFLLIIATETMLDVTSNMSYLSLIDRNHPLLKKLQMEAPGTYHHSERVALLAEEAADSIGAMSQKVQAYALFHDVGKLASPEMFTENASGKDMFTGKSPLESAAIIRFHVEYGVQLAKKYKLKTPLCRAIECHHGNDFISFFYEKEKERTGKIPPEEPFRYPGPLPGELETVILMLADCCEAAVCSMSEPTEENVRALVEKIFNGKLQRKQLDAAPVTMEQLAKIRDSFLKTLKSMNHTRISYSRHEEKDA